MGNIRNEKVVGGIFYGLLIFDFFLAVWAFCDRYCLNWLINL